MLNETGKEIEIGVTDEERQKRRAVLDKTTGEALRKKFNDESREEIEQAEQRLAPPVIKEPRCHVCNSQWRQHIERALIKGHSYQSIANSTPADPDGIKPSRRSIANHFKEHMDIDRTAVRAELEEEANLLRQNVEEGASGAMTTRGVLRVMVRRAYDDYVNGIITAEVRDVIQMIKLMNEMETDTATIKNEETEAALRIFLRAIQTICTPEQQGEIQTEVRRLREMDSLDYAMETHLDKPKAIEMAEAEVVDEGTHTESND